MVGGSCWAATSCAAAMWSGSTRCVMVVVIGDVRTDVRAAVETKRWVIGGESRRRGTAVGIGFLEDKRASCLSIHAYVSYEDSAPSSLRLYMHAWIRMRTHLITSR